MGGLSIFLVLEYSVAVAVCDAVVLCGTVLGTRTFFSLASPLPLSRCAKRGFLYICSLFCISFLTFSRTELNWAGSFTRSVFKGLFYDPVSSVV